MENKEKHWNSNALTIKILPLNTGIRKVRVCFDAATNVICPNVKSLVNTVVTKHISIAAVIYKILAT